MTRWNNELLESPDFLFHAVSFHLNGGERYPYHEHQFVELVYIEQGAGEHQYIGRSHRIGGGDVFLIQPYIQHAYIVHEDDILSGYNILFQPELLRKEIELLSGVSSFIDFYYVEPFLRQSYDFSAQLRLNVYETLDMKLILDRLMKEYTEKRPGYRVLVKTFLIELFVFLSRCYQSRNKPLSLLSGEQVISNVCRMIEIHYAEPLSLQQISKSCCMSVSSFKTKFKQFTGKTFLEYRNDIRLRVAKDLLVQSNLRVTDISSAVGYEDVSFFNKCFRSMYGVSPTEYRKTNKLSLELQKNGKIDASSPISRQLPD
ncbi:helix-turn-helix domain-containing protein [Paenibacillus sp. NPDC056579]|uniref:helix-turn-helix domain-containing protein n=1 Tax=Paenibacillus sp. NPDC056579 TaxID=3345871 RepID=UPI0036BB9CE5